MHTSKLRLVFYWLISVTGFYLFWLLAYFILTKLALRELAELDFNSNFGQQIKLDNVFWYALYIGGIVLTMYLIDYMISYSPNPKIAAAIYSLLIVFSVGLLIIGLSEAVRPVQIALHIFINGCFLIAIGRRFFKSLS